MGQVFLKVLQIFPIIVIPSVLHTHTSTMQNGHNRYSSNHNSTKTVILHHKYKKDSQKTTTLDWSGLE